MANTLLKVENVKKSFKIGNSTIDILKGISFEVNQGDFAIIFGPSGSGKSTLLHVILGLEIPSEGDVTFLGESFYKLKDEDDRSGIRKKHIGMVYQQPNWIKSLNVVENVAFPLILLGVEKAESVKQAWKQLEQINLQKWVSYVPTELSGGQQQRVALARALITNPSVIIADEPTGNLDFQAGKDLMNLLMKLNEQGRTIIMVTHDLEYLKYAKRAIQILDGQVVAMFDETNKDKMIENIQGKRGIETEISDKTVTIGSTVSTEKDSTSTSSLSLDTTSATKPVTDTTAPSQPQTLQSKIEQKLSETTTSPEVLHKESAATTKQETPQIEEKQITSPVSTIQDVSTLITQTESVKVDSSDTKTYDSSEYTTTNTTSSKPSKKLAPAKMMFRNTKS